MTYVLLSYSKAKVIVERCDLSFAKLLTRIKWDSLLACESSYTKFKFPLPLDFFSIPQKALQQ